MTGVQKPHSDLVEFIDACERSGDHYGFGSDELFASARVAVQNLVEQLQSVETTLAHAEAFIEHQDMSYRWAEWCEGRDPNPAKERP